MSKEKTFKAKIIRAAPILIPILIAILAVSVSVYSAIVAHQANELAYQANEHSKIIEQATLKIGHEKYTNDSIYISLINGYYSRYPALVTSAICCLDESGSCTKIKIVTEKESDWKLVERDNPSTLTLKLDTKNYTDGDHTISLEIQYVDFGEMKVKSIKPTYTVVLLNHSIDSVDLINVEEKVVRDIGS